MYDILLKNGTIVDGSGRPSFRGDVAVSKGKIVKIGDISGEAKTVFDVEGQYIAPGFIDSHSHSDWVVFMGLVGKSALEQGITTEICGNCGSSVAPLMSYDFDTMVKIPEEMRKELEAKGGTVKAVFDTLENFPLATNIALYIGQGVVRGKVMDYESRKPTPDEMTMMKEILREGMEAGALGMSSGLLYPPGSYSSTEELIELCSVVGKYEGCYATHMRSEGDFLLEAMEETVKVAGEAGASIVFSHHKVDGKNNEGKSRQSLEMIEKVKTAGHRLLVDMYPYTGAGAALMACIPHHFASQGKAALCEKFYLNFSNEA